MQLTDINKIIIIRLQVLVLKNHLQLQKIKKTLLKSRQTALLQRIRESSDSTSTNTPNNGGNSETPPSRNRQ